MSDEWKLKHTIMPSGEHRITLYTEGERPRYIAFYATDDHMAPIPAPTALIWFHAPGTARLGDDTTYSR